MKDWEKDFDEQFSTEAVWARDEVKKFISNLLDQKERKVLENLKEEIKQLRYEGVPVRGLERQMMGVNEPIVLIDKLLSQSNQGESK